MLLYSGDKASVRGTFWFHEYGVGDIRNVGTNLESEGVSDLSAIARDAARKNFLLVEFDSPEVNVAEFRWTDLLVLHASNLPGKLDFDRFVSINDKFKASLPAESVRSLPRANKTLFMTSATNSAGEEIVTVFSTEAALNTGKWLGRVFTVNNGPRAIQSYIERRLALLGAEGRVYLYGDEVRSINIAAIADRVGVDVVRRGPITVRDFVNIDKRLAQINTRALDSKHTAFINGLPESGEDLAAMRLPASGIATWKDFRSSVEHVMAGRFAARIESRDAFIKELSNGDKDIVVVIAHSDGASVYLGGEKLLLTDIESLPDRIKSSRRPRTAILLSCSAGKLQERERSLFRKQVGSLADILTRKNFVDQVIAPDHDIGPQETVTVLTRLVNGEPLGEVRASFDGWIKVAALPDLCFEGMEAR